MESWDKTPFFFFRAGYSVTLNVFFPSYSLSFFPYTPGSFFPLSLPYGAILFPGSLIHKELYNHLGAPDNNDANHPPTSSPIKSHQQLCAKQAK